MARKPITSKLSSHHLNLAPSTIMSIGSQEHTIQTATNYDRVHSGGNRELDRKKMIDKSSSKNLIMNQSIQLLLENQQREEILLSKGH